MSYRDDHEALEARKNSLARELAEAREKAAELAAARGREAEILRELEATTKLLDQISGTKRLPMLDDVRVASPCDESWDAMRGDERVRHCEKCDKNVFNLSAMTRDEAESLLRARAGLCVRMYRRKDGTVLTQDCPVGVRRRRLQRIAFVAIGAGLLASATALAYRPVRHEPTATTGQVALTQEYDTPTMGSAAPISDEPPPSHAEGTSDHGRTQPPLRAPR